MEKDGEERLQPKIYAAMVWSDVSERVRVTESWFFHWLSYKILQPVKFCGEERERGRELKDQNWN